MIGSPALRGAAASLGGGAGRACPATASAVSAVSAAIAASVNTAGGARRRIAAVDCAVENRLNMLCPVLRVPVRACADQCQITTFFRPDRHQHATNSLLGTIGRFDGSSLIYDSACRRKRACGWNWP